MSHVSSNAVGGRHYNLPKHQVSVIPGKHQIFTLPAQSQTAFGSTVSFQVRTEKNKYICPWAFEFVTSALTGATDSSGTAGLLPASFWVSRLEVYSGSQLIQTAYPCTSWAFRQAFSMENNDENTLFNAAAGDVSQALRATKSASTGTWYLFLHQLFFNKTKYLNLPGADLEFRLTMRPVNELVSTTGTLGGTAVCSINSLKLLIKSTNLPESIVQNATALIRRTPHHHAFSQTKNFSYSIPATTTSVSAVLTGITGDTSLLMFVLRPTPIANNNESNFQPITDFNILSGNGESLLGAEKMTAAQYAAVITPNWARTNFFYNNPNVYIWSFALTPSEVITEGSMGTGSHYFNGNETLVLTIPSSASALQLDVFADTSAIAEHTLAGLRLIQI